MTTNNDPWSKMSRPKSSFEAKKVEPYSDFWWILSSQSKLGFWYEFTNGADVHSRLPNLSGISVEKVPINSVGKDWALKFELDDKDEKGIFFTLCRDLFDSSENITDKQEIVDNILQRAWRWHHLLRGGSNKKLSFEEQKGLIGELLVLEKILAAGLDPVTALQCWTGPNAPKDFEIGADCIEVKARRGAAKPFVTINSEDQLDESNVNSLYLYVVNLTRSPADPPNTFNLGDLVNRLVTKMADIDFGSPRLFFSLLASSGYDTSHDYSEDLFIAGDHFLYEVKDDFPRITTSEIRSGTSKVRYSIALNDCQPYEVDMDFINKKLKEVANA